MNNRNLASIWDMIQAIRRIQDFTNQITYTEYLNSILLQSAVERQLEILGESANRISDDFQQQHSEIEWGDIIGLRNIIAHRYDQIRQDIIWNVIIYELVNLLEKLEVLLPS